MTDIAVEFPKPCGENWDEMTPTGCNRHCASCDKIIHDLSAMTIDDVENLLDSDEEACVRAKLDRQGAVILKPDKRTDKSRILAAVGASVGVLGLSAQPVHAKIEPRYTIAGKVKYQEHKSKVIATSASGKRYRASVNFDGSYEIRNVRPGTYNLEFSYNCFPGGRHQKYSKIKTIVVENTGKKEVVDAGIYNAYEENEFDFCPVIVGVMIRKY